MAAPTSTNEVTARKFSSSISALWTKIKSTFQTLGNLVTSWGSTPSDTKYPSEKLVKTSLDGKANSADAELSTTSTNPLQNKEITRWHNIIIGDDGFVSGSAANPQLSLQKLKLGALSHYNKGVNIKIYTYDEGDEENASLVFDIDNASDSVKDNFYNGLSMDTLFQSEAGKYVKIVYTGSSSCYFRALGVFMDTKDTSSTVSNFYGHLRISNVDYPESGQFSTWGSLVVAAFSKTSAVVAELILRPKTSASKCRIFGFRCLNTYTGSDWAVLIGRASSALKLTNSRKLCVDLSRTADSTFDGSADQTNIPVKNTLPVARGGTGKTSFTAGNYLLGNGTSALQEHTPSAAANNMLSALPDWSANPTDGVKLIRRDTGGSASFGQVTFLTVWNYIKGKISSVLGLTETSYGGNASTATALSAGADRTKLDGIAEGAEVNVQSDWNQATTTADDYIKNKPTIPAAVRVKGDAESSYRTGDVNLTPANIGLTDAAIRGKISAGTDLSYDLSTGVMKVDTTGTATGNYAFASGAATTASGNYSHAEGYSATASSTSAHAEGSRTVASTPAAHAEGHRTTASGISAHAEGYRDDGDEFAGFSVASGFGSHIEGINTKASDDASHAEGYLTESSGPHAHAEGESTVASGKDSHAEGLWSNASGLNSHAENSSFAYGENAHSEGYGQSSWGAVGVASHTEGSAAFAYGMSAHAEGGGTNALGKDSHAEGLGGGYRPVAITLTADHVAETSTFAGSTEGLSVGMYLLWKDDAHLTQQVSKITWVGNGTFGTQATFDSAIPAGTVVYAVDRGVAAGTASHVEGFGTSAVGMYSHAEGYLTKAIGEASHAEGQGTEARTGGMHAAGMYPATKEGFARVTGWGSAATPKDIERLSTQGILWVGGHFYGATPLKVVPGQTTYDEIYEAWSEQRPFVIEVSMLTHMAHAIYAPAIIRAVPLDQAMDHWEFHFRVDYPYNYRAAFLAGGQEPYKVSIYYLAINEQQGWGKLVSGTNEWASLSDSRWYSVPVEYAALAETATEAQNAAANSPLADAINGKSDVGHKHPISDLTMGILSASLGGTGYNNLSDACSAILKAVTLGTDPTMYADDEIMGSNHTSGATDTSKFVRRKASTMKAYVLNGGTMTGQFTNSYQGYGYQASHGTSNKYVGFKAYREDTQVGVSLEVGSSGKAHGVYSSKLGAWMLFENDDSKVHIYGDRLVINSAGALRGSNGVVTITNAAENAGGVLSAGALRQTSFISKSDTFEVTNTDATVRGDGQLYFYRNTNTTSAILAKWHVNSTSTFATGYIQPGCTGVFQLTNNTNNYFTRLS